MYQFTRGMDARQLAAKLPRTCPCHPGGSSPMCQRKGLGVAHIDDHFRKSTRRTFGDNIRRHNFGVSLVEREISQPRNFLDQSHHGRNGRCLLQTKFRALILRRRQVRMHTVCAEAATCNCFVARHVARRNCLTDSKLLWRIPCRSLYESYRPSIFSRVAVKENGGEPAGFDRENAADPRSVQCAFVQGGAQSIMS